MGLIQSCLCDYRTFKKFPELTDTRYVDEYARLTNRQKKIEVSKIRHAPTPPINDHMIVM